ncbi:MAG: hypothetical protein GY861_29320 [bacterium]|nr:hypothetical protein [bacterium]
MGGVTCLKHPGGKLDNTPKSSNWMFNINNKEMLSSKYSIDILTKDELFLELV